MPDDLKRIFWKRIIEISVEAEIMINLAGVKRICNSVFTAPPQTLTHSLTIYLSPTHKILYWRKHLLLELIFIKLFRRFETQLYSFLVLHQKLNYKVKR